MDLCDPSSFYRRRLLCDREVVGVHLSIEKYELLSPSPWLLFLPPSPSLLMVVILSKKASGLLPSIK